MGGDEAKCARADRFGRPAGAACFGCMDLAPLPGNLQGLSALLASLHAARTARSCGKIGARHPYWYTALCGYLHGPFPVCTTGCRALAPLHRQRLAIGVPTLNRVQGVGCAAAHRASASSAPSQAHACQCRIMRRCTRRPICWTARTSLRALAPRQPYRCALGRSARRRRLGSAHSHAASSTRPMDAAATRSPPRRSGWQGTMPLSCETVVSRASVCPCLQKSPLLLCCACTYHIIDVMALPSVLTRLRFTAKLPSK